jgi:cytochrome c553
MKFLRYSVAPIALLLMAAAPNGQSIAENGNNNGAMSCASCHGSTYGGNPALQAPALAGLPAATILTALNNFASNPSSNPMMHQVASALAPDERQAVATYLSGLKKAD